MRSQSAKEEFKHDFQVDGKNCQSRHNLPKRNLNIKKKGSLRAYFYKSHNLPKRNLNGNKYSDLLFLVFKSQSAKEEFKLRR